MYGRLWPRSILPQGSKQTNLGFDNKNVTEIFVMQNLVRFCLKICFIIADISFVNTIGQNMENKRQVTHRSQPGPLEQSTCVSACGHGSLPALPLPSLISSLFIKHSLILVFQMTQAVLVVSQYLPWKRPRMLAAALLAFALEVMKTLSERNAQLEWLVREASSQLDIRRNQSQAL